MFSNSGALGIVLIVLVATLLLIWATRVVKWTWNQNDEKKKDEPKSSA